MKGNQDKGFCLFYYKLSYRRKLIRSLWIMAIAVPLAIVTRQWGLLVAIIVAGSCQIGYCYYQWQAETRTSSEYAPRHCAKELNPITRWTILAAVVIGCTASAAMLGTGFLLFGWNPGQVDDMHFTNGLGNLIGWWSLGVAAATLILLVPFHRVAYFISMAIVAVPFLVALGYECIKYPKSHNLLGFELLAYAGLSAFLHAPSMLIRAILLRNSRWRFPNEVCAKQTKSNARIFGNVINQIAPGPRFPTSFRIGRAE